MQQRWLPYALSGMFLVLATSTFGCAGDATGPGIPTETQPTSVFDEKRMSVQLDGTNLELTIELGSPRLMMVAGACEVRLRDLDGTPIDQATADFSYGREGQALHLTLQGLPEDVTAADLVKYVIDYEVTWQSGDAHGSRSAFDALRKLEVILVTDDRIESTQGGHYSLFALDPSTSAAIADASVTVQLDSGDGPVTVAETTTDENGKASGEITLPGDEVGSGTLTVTVNGNGVTEISEHVVQIIRAQKILVTTDKPRYQPGQTIHARALALHTSDRTPEANQTLIFEIEDAKGNKVAKEQATTDDFGVAALDIPLANQINMGTWTIRAILGETITEKSLTVERYTLPKFNVSADLDQNWYRPGDSLTLTGEARYFFGQPVAGGTVQVVASTFDVEFTAFADLNTTTNGEGLFSLTLDVPSYVVGLPIEQGQGALKLDLVITDTAGQEFTLSRGAPIAEGGIEVALVPESGTLAANLENEIFVVTTDPMGNPLAATLSFAIGNNTVAELTTSEAGLGSFTLLPTDEAVEFAITATAGEETVTLSRTLQAGADIATVLVRTDQSIYAVGDTAQVEIRVGETSERVYMDLVQAGRTVDMRAIEVVDGVASHAFDIDPSMEGDLFLSAFYLTDDGTLVRDQKLLYVQSANDLTVSMTAPKETYLPGEKATIDIQVSDRTGAGTVAAVGVQIVDEAVFALQDVQPGLLKVFFDLMQELSAPQIHVAHHQCDATGVIIETPEETDDTYQDRARVAFAALSDAPIHSIQNDTYKSVVSEMLGVLQPYISTEKETLMTELSDLAMMGVITRENLSSYLKGELAKRLDFWNAPYAVEINEENEEVLLTSTGPDERAGTLDDFEIKLNYWEVLYGNQANMIGAEEMDADFGAPMAAGEAGTTGGDGAGSGGGAAAGIKVRDYFPETLYVNPAIITDANGQAQFEVDMADSITEWRITGLANAQTGLVGSGSGAITVFQDFFVDINFPTEITREDAFSVPVAIYNYLPETQTVNLTVEGAEWLEITGPTSQTLTLAPGEVTGAAFDIRALNVGVHGLTIVAQGSTMNDAVKRTVRVRPNGKAFTVTESSRFSADPDPETPTQETVGTTITIPENNIDGAQELIVKVYPGFASQVVEGMESMLRLPGG